MLYFAGLREQVGLSEEAITLTSTVATARTLLAELARRRPALASALHAVRFARNHAFMELDDPLADGDVVALIAPVSGG